MEKRVIINVTFSFPVIPVCPYKEKTEAGIKIGEDLDNGLWFVRLHGSEGTVSILHSLSKIIFDRLCVHPFVVATASRAGRPGLPT